jgi:tRNA(adenine34) deaminase
VNTLTKDWEPLMREALAEAQIALEASGDVPVGALIVDAQGNILSRVRNEKELHHDPTAHAEIVAIRAASNALGSWRLDGCTLVVTLEPCVMCAGAIQAARIERVVFGAWDEKVGASGSLYDLVRDKRLGSQIEVIPGVIEEECSSLLKNFFKDQRIENNSATSN